MSAIFQDISISLSRRRRICVLDPALLVSPFGLPLVKQMAECMQLWIPREFWYILDNQQFHLCEPSGTENIDDCDEQSILQSKQNIFCGLQEWEKIRANNDPVSLKLYWIGEGLGDSILPPDSDVSLFQRFECLGQALDLRLKTEHQLAWAYRDTVALSVLLPGAVILCPMGGTVAEPSEPAICQELRDWGLETQRLEGDDEWLKLERASFRQLLVGFGLAKLYWSGMRLALMQVLAPAASLVADDEQSFKHFDEDGRITAAHISDYWRGASAFWYPL